MAGGSETGEASLQLPIPDFPNLAIRCMHMQDPSQRSRLETSIASSPQSDPPAAFLGVPSFAATEINWVAIRIVDEMSLYQIPWLGECWPLN